jgi:hypothetical protein
MKLLSEAFKSVKKTTAKKNKQKTPTCQFVSELDVVGGL